MNFFGDNYLTTKKHGAKRQKKIFGKTKAHCGKEIGTHKSSKRTRELRVFSDEDVFQLESKKITLCTGFASEPCVTMADAVHESSSSQDDFFDAEESLAVGDFATPSTFPEIRIHISLCSDGSLNATLVGGIDDGKKFHVTRADFEKYGVDLSISSSPKDGASVSIFSAGKSEFFFDDAESESNGDWVPTVSQVNCEAQTSIVLGADDLTETEEVSVLSSRTRFGSHQTRSCIEVVKTRPVRREQLENSNDFTEDVSRYSDSDLYRSSMISRAVDTVAELTEETYNHTTHHYSSASSLTEEEPRSADSIHDSTQCSPSCENLSAVQNLVDQIRRLLQDDIIDSNESANNSVVFTPLIKAKSDSYLILGNTKVDLSDAEEVSDNPSISYASQNLPTSIQMKLQNDVHQLGYAEDSRYKEEQVRKNEMQYNLSTRISTKIITSNPDVPERPMTSAADAVNTMRKALKPISDQINDIRTKMIGMNIQPRACRPKIVEDVLEQISQLECQLYSNSCRRRNWLVSEPEDFSFQSSYDPKASTEDVFAPTTRQLVIFPGRRYCEVDDASSRTSQISLARSSIVTDPEDSPAFPNKRWM